MPYFFQGSVDKNVFMTLDPMVWQDHHNRCEDHSNGILQQKGETGLNLKYNKGKWRSIAKEQCVCEQAGCGEVLISG